VHGNFVFKKKRECERGKKKGPVKGYRLKGASYAGAL
jgi:hypothetical protein